MVDQDTQCWVDGKLPVSRNLLTRHIDTVTAAHSFSGTVVNQ